MRFWPTFAALLVPIAAWAAETTTPGPMVPVGYCQLAATGTAALVSTCPGGIPVGTSVAYITVEQSSIRWRDDGVAPTATVGMLSVSGTSMFPYQGDVTKMQIIASFGSPIVDFSFYKVHP